jgi:tetratricopeptide (TPR) repeat protein
MPPVEARLAIVVFGTPGAAAATAGSIAQAWLHDRAAVLSIAAAPAHEWPFRYPLAPGLPPDRPALVWVPDLHRAFVNHQSGGTRLITTQASYLLQAWLDAAPEGTLLLATAERTAIAGDAPEILARRGVFQHALIVGDDEQDWRNGDRPTSWQPPAATPPDGTAGRLAAAFRDADPGTRLAACVAALANGRTAAALVATASACMENNDLAAAARDLDEALAIAPEWAAAHYERGKLWLRSDDMERASEAFGRAAALMPTLGAAWANLGATFGELDRPAEALRAFERARACDPDSAQTINNIGVLSRELGRLAESEAAFRRVTMLGPDLAFGYYNLGHTLFLQGRYQAALAAYVEGQKRDAERNPVQASRLAMCRLAAGDSRGALAELARASERLPRESRRQLLADTQAIALALLTDRTDLAGWSDVNGWLTRELAKLA